MNGLVTLVASTLLLFLAPPGFGQGHEEGDRPSARLRSEQQRLVTLSEQLLALEPHVTLAAEGIATLDAKAARLAGFSGEVIELAQEMIEVQNASLLDIADGRPQGSGQPRPFEMKTSGHELLEEFLALATEVDVARGRGYLGLPQKAGTTNACGTYDNPVPAVAGPWWVGATYKAKKDAEKAIVRQGFHKTAWYVGTNDFTEGRSYKSDWGTCSSPRFRNHALVKEKSSKFTPYFQYGECNPEVASYKWPYWNWPSYCSWWHSTH